jgi:hypothetical protein
MKSKEYNIGEAVPKSNSKIVVPDVKLQKQNTICGFYVDIVADITTRNSELKDT